MLDKGVIAERGTHDELLARGGIYAGLWSRQREVDAAAGGAAARRRRRRRRVRGSRRKRAEDEPSRAALEDEAGLKA